MSFAPDPYPIPTPTQNGSGADRAPSEEGPRRPIPAEGLPDWNLEPPVDIIRRDRP